MTHIKSRSRGSCFLYEYFLQINTDILFFDVVLLCISGKDQRQRAVAGYVAGGSEAVLKCEDGKHESGTCIVKFQNAGDDTKGSHNGASGNAGCANGKYAKECAEQNHGSKGRDASVQDLGDGHTEEYLSQNGAAQMDVCKQRNTELYHIFTKRLAFVCALERNSEGSCRGHGSYCGKICRSVVFDDFHGVLFGVCARNHIQERHPDVMSDQHDHDNLQEYRKLFGDGTFVCKRAEGKADKYRKDRDDDLGNQRENDLLEFVQYAGDQLRFVPGSGKTDHDGEYQRAHYGHDLRDFKLEYDSRKLLEAFHIRHDGEMRDQRISGCHGKQSGADGRNISKHNGDTQHTGSAASKFGDRWCDKADDDQRYAEVDHLTKDVFQSYDNIQDCNGNGRSVCGIQNETYDNTQDNAYQKLKRQAGKKTVLFHKC